MQRILWTRRAQGDLRELITYIAQRNPSAARRMRDLIESSVLPLAQYPDMYRTGRVAGTREIVVHPNYIVVYRATATAVEILRVLHARQQYP